MHTSLLNAICVQGEGLARGADISLSTEVHFSILGDKHPHSDVKLTSVDQEGSLNVLLDDEGGSTYLIAWTLTVLSVDQALLRAFAYILHQLLVLICVEHMDATPSVTACGF